MSTEGRDDSGVPEKSLEDDHPNRRDVSPADGSSHIVINLNSRRSGARQALHYEPNLKSLYRCYDFSRPLASKEDTVVYYKRGEIGLAHVHKIDRKKLDADLYKGLISCQTLELETIPSCRRIRRLVEEVLVVDRGFSIGETVIKFENENAGDPVKEHMCIPRSDAVIGQVMNVEVRGDVLVVPSKNLIVRNVSLGDNDYTEMVNYNSAHNYIMYKEWIGNATDCINDVTLLYRGRHRFVVKEGGRSGVFLCRQDRSDDSKALVPGERVSIHISDALGRASVWEQKPPKTLTSSRRKRPTEGIKCIIEKIETNSLVVDWIMSPSSTSKPPKVIPKSELDRVSRIDPSANPRPSTCDRVKIVPDDSSTVVTVKEYFTSLTEQYRSVFKKLIAKEEESLTIQCENCSVPFQKELKQNSAKAPKMPRLSESAQMQSGDNNAASAHDTSPCDRRDPEEDRGEDLESSEESSDEDETPTKCGRSRVAVCRSVVRQKRMRKCPTRRRRCTPALPIECSRLAKDILGNNFVGEVLMSHTLVDVQWMNGCVEEKVPGYLLIPHDPDLDQQDHLPGVIVARKDAQDTETVFGLILSTDCAERSCKISWFQRTEDEVKYMADEECILFDIMAHPVYKRLFVGNYGVSINHPSNDMRDVAFQVVEDLKNGKQRVRFLNGAEEELWPFDILPISFVDESLDSESEDDDFSITEPEESKNSTGPDILQEASNILRCRGLRKPLSENDVADFNTVSHAVKYFGKRFPSLKKFAETQSPDDIVARQIELLFAGVVLEAMDEPIDKNASDLIVFADVMTTIYRCRALPDNFDFHVFCSLVTKLRDGGCESNLPSTDGPFGQHFSVASKVAENLPELLVVFHWVSEHFRGHDKDSVRIPLRSELHQHVDASSFKPRSLVMDYVVSIFEDLIVVHDVCDPIAAIPCRTDDCACDSRTSKKSLRMLVEFSATAHELAGGVERIQLMELLIAQLLDRECWPLEEMKFSVSKALLDQFPIKSGHQPLDLLLLKRTFGSALVLLHRCGLVSLNTLCRESLWRRLNFMFSPDYEAPRLVDYTTLHELVTFMRSVDYNWPRMLQRVVAAVQTCSLDSMCDQVVQAYQQKLNEISEGCQMWNRSEESLRSAGEVRTQKQCIGTFEVLDECPDRLDAHEVPLSRKFYTAVFKEHKVLSQHVPTNIHVHAFANRLNVLHVLIIGPVGTPFDTTPFFFKFKLPSDYPQKPPELEVSVYRA